VHLNSLIVKSNIKNYEAFFEESNNFIEELVNLNNSIFVVDEQVWQVHKEGILASLPAGKTIVQQATEDKKNIDTVCKLYEKIMQFAPKKNLNLVSIGGGIIQDITGFVASSLYRGVNWIFIPTTLLAQVDSCIGAKTSLNFKQYKNLIGTFYPPSKIYIYPEFLRTLTEYDYYSGVGEMAKFHLLSGEKATTQFIDSLKDIHVLKNEVILERIQKCLQIKKAYIEDDEFDTGKRNMLNYGHCFGHAIESSTNFAISHGQAVVLGMVLANYEAAKRGILSEETEKYIREKALLPILKVDLKNTNIKVNETIEAMGQDKKNTGAGLALVMLKNNYEAVKITDLTDEEARLVLEKFIAEGIAKK
jgi:3-dehydroquinate synthase